MLFLYDWVLCVIVFFFKQKTAYEMRISDWSSDVCSSDLAPSPPAACTATCAPDTRTTPLSWQPLDASPTQVTVPLPTSCEPDERRRPSLTSPSLGTSTSPRTTSTSTSECSAAGGTHLRTAPSTRWWIAVLTERKSVV